LRIVFFTFLSIADCRSQAVFCLFGTVNQSIILTHIILATGIKGIIRVLAIVFMGDAEQGIIGDIQSALVLRYGIDKGIAGKGLATE
jgi:hypothetical protein